MHDPLLVGRLERLGDLARDGERLLHRQGARLEPLGKRRPLDQLHDQAAYAAGFFEAKDRGDVRMLELREDLRFALEARQALLILRESRWQDLDRDFALQARVDRAVYLSHSAFAELGGDLVGAEALSDHAVAILAPKPALSAPVPSRPARGTS